MVYIPPLILLRRSNTGVRELKEEAQLDDLSVNAKIILKHMLKE